MNIQEAMAKRHAVRSYLDKPIASEAKEMIEREIEKCNEEGNLRFQFVKEEPNAFDGFLAHYGKFKGVRNYIALVAKKGEEEKVGYYGERIVLLLQTLGLGSCWVAMTYRKTKNAFVVKKGEKLYCVISLGYPEKEGANHKTKSVFEVSNIGEADAPKWFIDGMKAALLAPTAMNQQKFSFLFVDGKVLAKSGFGFYTKIDLGIAKYLFEVGSGKDGPLWLTEK